MNYVVRLTGEGFVKLVDVLADTDDEAELRAFGLMRRMAVKVPEGTLARVVSKSRPSSPPRSIAEFLPYSDAELSAESNSQTLLKLIRK